MRRVLNETKTVLINGTFCLKLDASYLRRKGLFVDKTRLISDELYRGLYGTVCVLRRTRLM